MTPLVHAHCAGCHRHFQVPPDHIRALLLENGRRAVWEMACPRCGTRTRRDTPPRILVMAARQFGIAVFEPAPICEADIDRLVRGLANSVITDAWIEALTT